LSPESLQKDSGDLLEEDKQDTDMTSDSGYDDGVTEKLDAKLLVEEDPEDAETDDPEVTVEASSKSKTKPNTKNRNNTATKVSAVSSIDKTKAKPKTQLLQSIKSPTVTDKQAFSPQQSSQNSSIFPRQNTKTKPNIANLNNKQVPGNKLADKYGKVLAN